MKSSSLHRYISCISVSVAHISSGWYGSTSSEADFVRPGEIWTSTVCHLFNCLPWYEVGITVKDPFRTFLIAHCAPGGNQALVSHALVWCSWHINPYNPKLKGWLQTIPGKTSEISVQKTLKILCRTLRLLYIHTPLTHTLLMHTPKPNTWFTAPFLIKMMLFILAVDYCSIHEFQIDYYQSSLTFYSIRITCGLNLLICQRGL